MRSCKRSVSKAGNEGCTGWRSCRKGQRAQTHWRTCRGLLLQRNQITEISYLCGQHCQAAASEHQLLHQISLTKYRARTSHYQHIRQPFSESTRHFRSLAQLTHTTSVDQFRWRPTGVESGRDCTLGSGMQLVVHPFHVVQVSVDVAWQIRARSSPASQV